MSTTLKNSLKVSVGALVLLAPIAVFGQSYVPIEPLPFFTTTNPSFPQFLQAAFRLTMLAGAALAILMLTIGGVQYMTSDVLGQKEQGRSRIKNALLGFLLLLAIYTILETINPDLLQFKLITQMVGRAPTSTTDGSQLGTQAGSVVGSASGGQSYITVQDEQGREARYPIPDSAPQRGYYYIGANGTPYFQENQGLCDSAVRVARGSQTASCSSYSR